MSIVVDDIVHNIGSIQGGMECAYRFTIIGQKLGTHDIIVGMENDKVILVTGWKEVCSGNQSCVRL